MDSMLQARTVANSLKYRHGLVIRIFSGLLPDCGFDSQAKWYVVFFEQNTSFHVVVSSVMELESQRTEPMVLQLEEKEVEVKKN